MKNYVIQFPFIFMNGIGHGCFWLNENGRHLADLQKDAIEIASALREMGQALKSA